MMMDDDIVAVSVMLQSELDKSTLLARELVEACKKVFFKASQDSELSLS